MDDLQPTESVYWGPLQFDSKFAFYLKEDNPKASPTQYFDFFLEDKVWYDFGPSDFGRFRIYLASKYAAYSSGSIYNSANPFHGSWVRPGLIWKLGDFTVEGYWALNYYDTSSSDTNDYATIGGVAKTFKAAYSDPMLKVDYCFKF